VLSQAPAEVETVPIGKHDVENDKVGFPAFQLFERALRAWEDARQHPCQVEVIFQQRGELGLVFNDRDLLWHAVFAYPLIAAKNSAFPLVLLSLSSSSSMVSTGESGLSTLRRIHTRFSSSFGSSSSSLRVPLLLMSMAGNTRLSTSFRSRWISMLPLPLNSSKIPSSMRMPVSIRADAIVVSVLSSVL